MKMNIKPAFRYQFDVFFKGFLVIFLILAAAIAGLIVISLHTSIGTTNVTFSGYGITASIFLFVMGIVNIRSDLRLCLQYGVSRRTSFASEILAVLSISIILSVAGELLTCIVQALSTNVTRFFIADIYQLIFVGPNAISMTFSQHLLSILLNTCLTFFSCLFGMFFSLMFWRLNKLWSIVVAVLIPISINVVPLLLSKLGLNLAPFIGWATASPFHYDLIFLFLAVLLGIFDWLLLRRANIKEAK